MEVIARGEWTVSRFRNRDVRAALYPRPPGAAQLRRQSGRVTRALGIIKKVSGCYRYQLITSGRPIVTAPLVARQADVEELVLCQR